MLYRVLALPNLPADFDDGIMIVVNGSIVSAGELIRRVNASMGKGQRSSANGNNNLSPNNRCAIVLKL